jgi:hypothetical protein
MNPPFLDDDSRLGGAGDRVVAQRELSHHPCG